MDMSSYLKQHKEALNLVDKIEEKLINTAENAEEINTLLVELISKLGFHLSLEDKFLYPKSIESTNDNLKNTAAKMKDEMGEIGSILDSYAKSWTSSEQIKNAPEKFINETKGIIQELKNRIKLEEKELYPLAAMHLD